MCYPARVSEANSGEVVRTWPRAKNCVLAAVFSKMSVCPSVCNVSFWRFFSRTTGPIELKFSEYVLSVMESVLSAKNCQFVCLFVCV